MLTDMCLRSSVPIEDPDFYLNDPWPTFGRMRREQPFYYYEPLDTLVVTRHRDIREVSIRPNDFVNSRGIFLADQKYRDQAGEVGVTNSFFPQGGEQVGTTDPPRHQELRRVIASAFSVPALESLSDPVRRYVGQVLDELTPGEVFDWMPVAAGVPITAACHLIGLPQTDHDRVQFWSDELEKLGGDLTFEEIQRAAANFTSLQDYIVENVERLRHRHSDGTDLLSCLINAELDDRKVSQPNIVMFAMTALAAGSDTTRALLAGIAYCFANHPGQWEHLQANRKLVPNAIEEILRWVTPARAFLRVAACDTSINGHEVATGQGLYLMYMAANRDDAEFVDPQRFDVSRHNAGRHLAFGAGPHLCAGMRLARKEGVIVLNAMLDRYRRIELAGAAVPVRHIIRNGWETMPVRLIA